MFPLIHVTRVNATHIVVYRRDYSLTGQLISTVALLPNGSWRQVDEAHPPEDCWLALAVDPVERTSHA